MRLSQLSATAVAFAASFDVALAHYRWTSLIEGTTVTTAYEYVRQNTNDNSPVTNVTSDDLRCNVGGLASGNTTQVASVAAGSTAGFALDQAIYHAGVINVYMSKTTDNSAVTDYDGSGTWFKISELGPVINSTGIYWPAVGLDSWSFQIPAATPSGQYLLRIEQIALHVAQSVGGAQFYISCANLEVTDGGSGDPEPTIQLPGGYSATDPGILIDIYYPVPTNYTMPGPAVWTG